MSTDEARSLALLTLTRETVARTENKTPFLRCKINPPQQQTTFYLPQMKLTLAVKNKAIVNTHRETDNEQPRTYLWFSTQLLQQLRRTV